MSSRTTIWILVAFVAAGVIFFNARMQFRSAKNNAKEQYIADAHIKITAPRLEEKTVNEKKMAEALKATVYDVSVYGVFHRKAEYSVIFMKYKMPPELAEAVSDLEKTLKNYNFEFNKTETNENGAESVKLSGTLEIDGGKRGLEAIYVKRDSRLWQILTIFPFSEENKKTALDFINSVVIDPETKDIPAGNKK